MIVVDGRVFTVQTFDDEQMFASALGSLPGLSSTTGAQLQYLNVDDDDVCSCHFKANVTKTFDCETINQHECVARMVVLSLIVCLLFATEQSATSMQKIDATALRKKANKQISDRDYGSARDTLKTLLVRVHRRVS
jgi:hypothetical protein